MNSDPASPEADRTIQLLSYAIRNGGGYLAEIPGLVKRVIGGGMYRDRIIQETGVRVSFDEFVQFVMTPPLEGLGTTIDYLKHLCSDDMEARTLIDMAMTREAGRPTAIVSNRNDNEAERPVGTTVDYALRKLRKDRPDLLERVLADDLSPHAAMVEAGFRPKTATFYPDDLHRTAAVLRRHLSDDGRRALVALLSEDKP